MVECSGDKAFPDMFLICAVFPRSAILAHSLGPRTSDLTESLSCNVGVTTPRSRFLDGIG